MKYYIKDSDTITGPFANEQIKAMWFDGKISGNAEYRPEDMDVWLPVTDLADDFSPKSRTQSSSSYAAAKYAHVLSEAQPQNGLILFGIFVLVAGVLLCGYFAILYDTTVSVESRYIDGVGSVGGGRVHNVGLMSNRQTGIIVGAALSVIGLIVAFVGNSRNKK